MLGHVQVSAVASVTCTFEDREENSYHWTKGKFKYPSDLLNFVKDCRQSNIYTRI